MAASPGGGRHSVNSVLDVLFAIPTRLEAVNLELRVVRAGLQVVPGVHLQRSVFVMTLAGEDARGPYELGAIMAKGSAQET